MWFVVLIVWLSLGAGGASADIGNSAWYLCIGAAMTVGVEVLVRVPPAAFKHVLYHSVPGPLLDMAFGLLKSNYVLAAIALGLWPVVLIFTALSFARHQGRKLQWKICRCGYFSGRRERRVSAYMFL